MFKNKFISFKTRLLMGFFSLILMTIIVAIISIVQFSKTQADSQHLDQAIVPHALEAEAMTVDIIQVQQFLTDVSATHDPAGYDDAKAAAEDFKKRISSFQHNEYISAEEKASLLAIEKQFDDYYALGQRMAAAYMNQGIDAGNAIMEEFDTTSLKLTEQMRNFKDQQVTEELQTTKRLSTSSAQSTQLMLAISAAIILLSFGIAFYLTRYLSKQMGIDPFYAKGIALELANGNFSREIVLEPGDTKSLLHAIKIMQQAIFQRITETERLNNEILRIKIALDNASTGMMITDNDRNIIYCNQAVMALLTAAEANIRQSLPNFSVNQLIGSNIDMFHKVPKHQAELLKTFTNPHKVEIEFGGYHLLVTAAPVINENGERLGSVAEWVNRSTEVEAERAVAKLVSAASIGEFNERIQVPAQEGFFRQVSLGLNQLMDICEVSLKDVVRVLEALSNGNLTEKIDSSYSGTFGQLKNSSNSTVENLRALIDEITDSTNTINTAAREIASGNNDLSHRTEEQAASLEQTSASMKELTSTVQANAENAKQANHLAQGASDIAGKGVTVIGQVVTTMDSINESSRKIVDIISVIDGIAFQTNILALNAAVEAARAGEQGRGFAVVAGEVRSLAQRAASAAGEIKGLIGDSVEKVNDGSQLVVQAGHTMEEIVNSILRVTNIMAEITAASAEQSTGISQVNNAIEQMDDVTQQNAALVEQAAAAAESLEEQAQHLSLTVAKFDLAGNSPKPASYSAAPIPTSTPSANLAPKPAYKAPEQNSSSDWEEF